MSQLEKIKLKKEHTHFGQRNPLFAFVTKEMTPSNMHIPEEDEEFDSKIIKLKWNEFEKKALTMVDSLEGEFCPTVSDKFRSIYQKLAEQIWERIYFFIQR